MDNIDILTGQILNDILEDTQNIMWKLARTTRIPGYDADDLMQEMRIKVWETVKKNDYDPDRCKPTSFYYRVCKNHLINLNKSTISRYSSTEPQKRVYRDCLNSKIDQNDADLSQIGGIQPNFVQNFSESFVNDYFLNDLPHQ